MEWGGTISQVEYSEDEDSGLIYSKNINLEGGQNGSPVMLMVGK